MMNRTHPVTRRRYDGFTLIEAVVFLFIFSMITMTFYQLFALGSRHMLDAKRRLGATALANERMETIRGMIYDDIGTKTPDGSGGWDYGIPAGEILENETAVSSGGTYAVHVFVKYADDDFDGTGTEDANGITTDYKAVRVSVSWGADGSDTYRTVSVFATFTPDGVEQASNTGILAVNVLDSSGVGVPQATVHIVNPSTGTDLTAQTDDDGNLTLPGATPSDSLYELTVSKGGYYGAHTYPPASGTVFDPVDGHMSVIVAAVNQYTIVMDHEADIAVSTVDPFGTPVPGIDFHLEGGRQIATNNADPLVHVPIFDFVGDGRTDDTDGEVSYPGESHGRYWLNLAPSVVGYEILLRHSESDPVLGREVIDVSPDESVAAEVTLLDVEFDSVLFSVSVDNAGIPSPVAEATVRLTEALSGYDATVETDERGQAFFPTESTELPAGTYSYEITKDGYVTETGSVTVDGNGLVKEATQLTAS